MTRASEQLETVLARIADPAGEGARACLSVYAASARAAAEAADARQRAGMALGPLDGVIVTIKDLFDVAGEVTRAGSALLAREGRPAAADAVAVKRLQAAGAVIVAKTNMSEFAFSGVGTNPHFGTPGNPYDRARVPGGSTSGGAVAVADGLCAIAIGTDTGGSTRIPAALCGLVGFKPTKARIPTDGAFPLSRTLDSIGPMARSVAECQAADAVLAGGDVAADEPKAIDALKTLRGVQVGVVQGLPLSEMEPAVAAAFARGLDLLGRAGAELRDMTLPLLAAAGQIAERGGIVPPEAYAVHRDRLARAGDAIDPHIHARIARAATMNAADYIINCMERDAACAAMDAALEDIDVLAMPTTPIVAPLIAEVASAEGFAAKNALLLRNTSLVNFFDLCAISLPLPVGDAMPCGLMLIGRRGHDRLLLRIARAAEQALVG